MIDVDYLVSPRVIQRLLAAYGLTEFACKQAARRAVAKCAKWTQAQAARTVSSELRLAQKIVRQRLRLYNKGDAFGRKVWLGLNAVAANRFGRVAQNARGVSVAGRQFDGAFTIRRYGGGVYRRTGRDRFPLELVKVPIDDAGANALRQAAKAAEDRLMVLLRQELNFEFQKVLGSTK